MKSTCIILHLLLIVVSTGTYAEDLDLDDNLIQAISADIERAELLTICGDDEVEDKNVPAIFLDYRYLKKSFIVYCEGDGFQSATKGTGAIKIGETNSVQFWQLPQNKQSTYLVSPFVRVVPVTPETKIPEDIPIIISYHDVAKELGKQLVTIYELINMQCQDETIATPRPSNDYSYSFHVEGVDIEVKHASRTTRFELGEHFIVSSNEMRLCLLSFDVQGSRYRCKDEHGDNPVKHGWFIQKMEEKDEELTKQNNVGFQYTLLFAALRYNHIPSLTEALLKLQEQESREVVGDVTIMGERYLELETTQEKCDPRVAKPTTRGNLVRVSADTYKDKVTRVTERFTRMSVGGTLYHEAQLQCRRVHYSDENRMLSPMAQEQKADITLDYMDVIEFKKHLKQLQFKCESKHCIIDNFNRNDKLGLLPNSLVRVHCEENAYLLSEVSAVIDRDHNLEVSKLENVVIFPDDDQLVASYPEAKIMGIYYG